jgi:hypothetical protein
MHTADRDRRLTWVYVAVLAAVSFLSRLPQLSSPHLLLDGDECILGLMSKHIVEGRAVPVFLYGQTYGLAIVESSAVALSFLIAGTGVLQLKLAMLALWTVGIAAYFVAVARLLGNSRSFWITLVLVLMPAWAVASTKAWSGYVTAFTAAAVLLNLLTLDRGRPRAAVWLAAGGVTAAVYLAQPLWVPGMLPIVAFVLLAHFRRSFAVLYLAGITAVLLAVKLSAARILYSYWTLPAIGNRKLLESWPALFEQLHVNLTGSYYLWFGLDPGPATAAAGHVWLGVLAAALLRQLHRLISRTYLLWSHVLFISVMFTLGANWLLLEGRDGRYLLPLSALLVLWAGVEICDLIDRRIVSRRVCAAAIACGIALQAVSMIEFRNYSYFDKPPLKGSSEAKMMDHVTGYMGMKGVRHAFSLHALLQWQLAFYSKEAVVARWVNRADRYPPYVVAVDRALQDGETVALVGYADATGGLEKLVADPKAIVIIDGKYFVYVGPDKALLRRLGFRITNH